MMQTETNSVRSSLHGVIPRCCWSFFMRKRKEERKNRGINIELVIFKMHDVVMNLSEQMESKSKSKSDSKSDK